jgi:hypothetical protein
VMMDARRRYRSSMSLKKILHCSGRRVRYPIGYLPADPDIGPTLHEVIATRYEKNSSLICVVCGAAPPHLVGS